jgi:hypothetical protein
MVFLKTSYWRNHPRLNVELKDWRYAMPGFGWGLGAIGTFLALEFVGIIPKKAHHGAHHGHDDNHGHGHNDHGKKH